MSINPGPKKYNSLPTPFPNSVNKVDRPYFFIPYLSFNAIAVILVFIFIMNSIGSSLFGN